MFVCLLVYYLICISSLFGGFAHPGYLTFETKKEALVFEGSQALPVCSSDKDNIIYTSTYIYIYVLVYIILLLSEGQKGEA